MLEWPNAERELREWLKARTGREVYTETNSTLEENLPAYQITRVGGAGWARRWIDRSVDIELDSIAGSRGDMWSAAERAATAMLALRANGTAEMYVDDVEELFAPAVEPYENSTIRRCTATYRLTLRPRTTQ